VVPGAVPAKHAAAHAAVVFTDQERKGDPAPKAGLDMVGIYPSFQHVRLFCGREIKKKEEDKPWTCTPGDEKSERKNG
jgi:hypothetical protein